MTEPEQLLWISEASRDGGEKVIPEGSYFCIKNELDMSRISNWQPISGAAAEFTIVGMGNTIKGLKVEHKADSAEATIGALFTTMGEDVNIQDLRIEGSTVTSATTAGINVGGLAGASKGDIKNVFVDVNITAPKQSVVGGIVGINEGSIEKTISIGTVSCKDTKVGMIAGKSTGTIDKVFYRIDKADSELVAVADGTDTSAARTDEDFKSGSVTVNLAGYSAESSQLPVINNDTNRRGDKWFQKIGEDDYPVLDKTHGIVYCGYQHGELDDKSLSFSNTKLHEETDDLGLKKHFSCCEWTNNKNGTHSGECTVCGKKVSEEAHVYKNGQCESCGAKEAIETKGNLNLTYGYTENDIKVVLTKVPEGASVTYQWFKKNVDGSEVGVPDSDSPDFPQGMDAGTYYCSVVWYDGAKENNVHSDEVTVARKKVSAVVTGSYSKDYDGTVDIDNAEGLGLSLDGVETGDVVTVSSDAVGFKFVDKNVGARKNITHNGELSLYGADKDNYELEAQQCASDVGTITKATVTAADITISKVDSTTAAVHASGPSFYTVDYNGKEHTIEAEVRIGGQLISDAKVNVHYSEGKAINQGQYYIYVDVEDTKNLNGVQNLRTGKTLAIKRLQFTEDNITDYFKNFNTVKSTTYYCIGKAIEPVKYELSNDVKNKVELSEKDYEITYQNNIVSGAATVSIRGLGNCSGEVTGSFSIQQKEFADNMVKVSYVYNHDSDAKNKEVTMAATAVAQWLPAGVKITPEKGYKLIQVENGKENQVSEIVFNESGKKDIEYYVVADAKEELKQYKFLEKVGDDYKNVKRTYKVDNNAPTGKISIEFGDEEHSWSDFRKEQDNSKALASMSEFAKTITITSDKKAVEAAKNDKTKIESVECLVTEKALKINELDKVATGTNVTTSWVKYDENSKPKTVANKVNIIYVRIKDTAGHIVYVNSDKIISDVTKPKVVSAEALRVYDNRVKMMFNPSELGTYYCCVRPAAEATPNAATIKLGTVLDVSKDSQVGKANEFDLTTLNKDTDYKVYFYGEDIVGNEMATAVAVTLKTEKTQPDVIAPELVGKVNDNVGDLAITGGSASVDGKEIAGAWALDSSVDKTTKAVKGQKYAVKFSPTDTSKYGSIVVDVEAKLSGINLAEGLKTEKTHIEIGKDTKCGAATGACVYVVKDKKAVKHEPTVNVYYKNELLVKNTDYKVTYSDPHDKAGKATITITGINKYEGEITRDYNIAKAPSYVSESAASVSVTYTAVSAKDANVFDIVKYDGLGKVNKKETMVVSPEAAKTEGSKLQFAIKKDSSKDYTKIKNGKPDGKAAADGVISIDEKGKCTVNGAGTTIIEVTTTGTDNYLPSAKKEIAVNVSQAAATTWSAVRSEYRLDEVQQGKVSDSCSLKDLIPVDAKASKGAKFITDSAVITTGNGIDITNVEVSEDGALLYDIVSVTGVAATSTGTITVNMTCNNYAQSTVKLTVGLSKAQQSKLVIDEKDITQVYGDTEDFTIHTKGGSTLTDIESYRLSATDSVSCNAAGLFSIKKAGKTTVTITKGGDVNYLPVSASAVINVLARPLTSESVSITMKNTSGAAVTSGAVYAYTGKEIKPEITVTESSKIAKLTKDDYEISYENNIESGVAKAVVKGKGNYSGTVTLNFTIERAETPTPSASSSNVPTATPTGSNAPTATPTGSDVPTATPTGSNVPTATPTDSNVPTATPTDSNVPTTTPTGSNVPTTTPTGSNVPTTTPTGSNVPTATPTGSNVPTPTPTGSNVPTPTPTGTQTPGGLKGDYDNDGHVTLEDTTLTLKVALKLVEPGDEEKARVDVDGDGKVTLDDVQKILKFALKIITEW